jgi:hypothetical protein
MSTRKSTKIPDNPKASLATKIVLQRHVLLPLPEQRRERTAPTSFSMPPSLRKKLKDYARATGWSISELVTFMCVKYLEAVELAAKTTSDQEL